MQKNPDLLYAVFPGAELADGPTVYGFIIAKNSKVSTIEELRKKNVIAINPYTKMSIQAILTASKIPEIDWPIISVAARDAALNAVNSGQATAAIMDQPALAVAIASGDFKLLEANPRAKHIGSPYWSGSGAVLKEHWKNDTLAFIALMKVIDEALVYIDRDPVNAHRILAKRLGLDPSIANQMGGYYFPKSTEKVDLSGIKETVNALVTSSLLEKPIKMEDFFPSGTYGAQ
jgi:ABC-type nitrate/sulfonate/bicarbonate transport system substrate-binding protein